MQVPRYQRRNGSSSSERRGGRRRRRIRNSLLDALGFLPAKGATLVALIAFVIVLAYLAAHLPENTHTATNDHHDGTKTKTTSAMSMMRGGRVGSSWQHQRHHHQQRIAIVLPFVGMGPQHIPSYLALFCTGAQGAADIADFLLIHNGVLDDPYYHHACSTSENVKMINLGSTEAFAEQLLRVIDHKTNSNDEEEEGLLSLSRKRLVQLVSKQLERYPYCLVEFKPALGHIFAEYLTEYSHWGYSDLDMLYGDLGRWVTPSELQDFDIVTYGFGDQQRLYLRGQFTFHKNDPAKINQLWRSCDYLSDMDKRLADVIHGEEKYHFESAEGCYSVAILQQTDIKVKYAVKAWTDISETDTAYSHGLYLARQQQQQQHGKARNIIYKATSVTSGSDLLNLSPQWFEQDRVYKDRKRPLQEPVGELQEISLPNENNKKTNCMYWVQKKYQRSLCLSSPVMANETVFWIDGKLYKQTHENVQLQNNVQTGPFFHFQEWKRYYRPNQLASLHPSSPVSTFVLTKEGAIPMLDAHEWNKYSHENPSPLGLLMKHWKTAQNNNNNRRQLPSRSYCLISGPRKFPPQPPAPECYQMVSWQDTEQVEILSGAPEWSNNVQEESDVTLVLTLQITESQARNRQALSDITEIVATNLEHFQGQPCVVVMHVAGATEEAMAFLRHRFGPDSELSIGIENSLIAVVFQEDAAAISRKALLNMAIDAVPTRWYISGIELERGLILSTDTVFVAHRAVMSQDDSSSGHVFLLPQFALDEEESGNITLTELVAARNEMNLHAPADMEEECDEDVTKHLDKPHKLWWAQVERILDPEQSETDSAAIASRAESIFNMEIDILQLLTDEHHLTMFALDESPILLTDNIGPQLGMRTEELVREAEELAGRRCYNGLRLAQMAALGYKLDVLEGAFAVSAEESRKAPMWGVDKSVPGSSRCDGCFMFGDDHEDILENLVTDEIRRPGKSAILWYEKSIPVAG